jgi:riboflavin biosynthesis pyrimidine reductase
MRAYGDLTDADLAALYAYPAGPVLRANMVASADGAASLDGASAGLSSAADRHVFALLRTLADVILVGAGTARAEHYAPVRIRELWKHLRAHRTPTPPIAVITARMDLDLTNAGEETVDMTQAVKVLHDRGYQHILAEGGPGILGQLTGAGLVDELCLTIGPLLAGPGAPRIVTGPPAPAPVPLSLAHALEADGFLLCRYQKTP